MAGLALRFLVAAISLAAAVHAQAATTAPASEDLRGFALGEIRNARGEPWAGAEVVLCSRPLPNDPNVGEPDEVTATTDAQGRFRAPILRGRPYTAWAWGEAGASGRPATAVIENVFVQRPMVAREERMLPVRRVVLDGMDGWSECTGFAIRVVDQTANLRVAWVEVHDGAATLPFVVGPTAFVEVLAKKDEVRIPLARVCVASGDPAELRIDLPERQRVQCWVRTSQRAPKEDSDRARAGAIVYRRLGGALYPAGTTDAAGRLTLDIAKVAEQVPEFSTLVLAEGCLSGICTVASAPGPVAPARTQDLPAGAEPGDLFANLDPGETVHARIVGAGRKPLAGLTVWLAGLASSRPGRSSARFDQWVRGFTTDAHGQVRLDGVRQQGRRAAHVLLHERDYQALPPRWRVGLLPIVFAPLVGAPGKGTADDPIVVDLCSMCPIDLCLTEAGGTPAVDVQVAFRSLASEAFADWPGPERDATADQLGRVRILVPGGQHLGFRAVRGMSLLIRGIETGRGRPDDDPAVARFQLPPPVGISGRLLEPGGGPGRDRTVHATLGGNNTPAAWSYASEDASVLADREHNRVRVLLPDDERERLVLTGFISRQVATDAEGRFAVPLPPDPIPGLMLFNAGVGERAFWDSIVVDWRGETKDLEWTARQ